MLKLEIGGKTKIDNDWIHLDYVGDVAIKQDLRKMQQIPLDDNSVDLVFGSHIIEHIENNHMIFTLKELHRIMKPNAILRLSCPDADFALHSYYKGSDLAFSYNCRGNTLEEKFINYFVSYSYGMGVPNINPNLVKQKWQEHLNGKLNKFSFLDWCIETFLDRKQHYIAHCNWYNYQKLSWMLENIGFNNIARSKFNESENAELQNGFDKHKEISLFIECKK